MKSTFFVLVILAMASLSFASESSYEEQRPPQVRNEKEITARSAQCTKSAIDLASKILSDKNVAKALVAITSFEDFSDQAWDYEKKESFAFGRGESGLTVVMFPNYYGDGKCQFDSAQMWRD